MKQFNYEITKKNKIFSLLDDIKAQLSSFSYSALLFHIYSTKCSNDELKIVQNAITASFPDAFVCGTSTNGDIYAGQLSENGLVLSLSVFESTSISVQLLECAPGQEESIGQKITSIIDSTTDIVAAEILITLKSINSHSVLNEVEKLQKKIQIFGGGSAANNIYSSDTKVFDKENLTQTGVVLITYSSKDLVVNINHAIGWKPLGKDFEVTKIEGKHLYELDEIPAGEVYAKYLDIHPDDDFFSNILEFPIMSHQHGYDVLRLPFSCDSQDNSIILAAAIDKGTPVNLSYGDPEVIQDDVAELLKKTKEFAPQAIFLYSCGVRRLYWKYLINKETSPFEAIAPVSGFYSSGEIMGMGDYIIEHHVTLLAISMREGCKTESELTDVTDRILPRTEEQKIHNQISIVRRLANFINVTTAELREANTQLQEMAETDALTGVYNRRMLDRLLSDAINRANKYDIKMTIGIVDIDDFKEVNDTFGHDVGDLVLKTLSKAMYEEVEKLPSGIFGRWGGEEFLFIAPTLELNKISDAFEAARKRVSSIEIEKVGVKTVSLGLTQFTPGDTIESIFKRADEALYEAKNTGKNKMCIK